MPYPIINSVGTTLATIQDGTVNNSTTSLTLIGKNYAGYGNFLNENFVYLLENFSDNTAPANPITGQLWYDNFNQLLKLYTGTLWKPISSSQAAATAPSNPVIGDLWWNTTAAQLEVWSGSAWVVIGPIYTSTTGTSGALVQTINDSLSNSHVVLMFYISNSIYAILSKDASFTPQTAISGFTTINPGFNLINPASLPNAQFTGSVSNALTLQGVSAGQFLRSDQNATTNYILTAGGGLFVGSDLNINPNPTNNEVQIKEVTINRNMNFYVNQNGANIAAISVTGANAAVGFANTVIVGGNVTAAGAVLGINGLTVGGITTLQNTLLPNANATISIGSITTQFANIYAANFVGNVAATVLNPTQIFAGGSYGVTGQYLEATGTGLTWATPSTISTGTNYVQTGASSVIQAISSVAIETVTASGAQITSLGVGTAPSGTIGEIRAINNITAYYSSDAKFKQNVQPIQGALAVVDAVGGKTFEWTEDYISAHGGEDPYFLQKNDFGVIAQDLQAVFPMAVKTRDDGSLAVDYPRLVALAFAAIKDLNAKVDDLTNKLKGA